MNKTQKSSWFSLIMTVLLIAFGVIITSDLIGSTRMPGRLLKFWMFLIPCYMCISFFFLRKKQSPAEVESDERDSLIKKRAVLACFISVCISLFVAGIIPQVILGEGGTIPVSMLPIINFGIFLIAFLVYSIAVLVQYGLGVNDGEN